MHGSENAGVCWNRVTKAFFSQCRNSRWDPVLTEGGNEPLAQAQSCGDPPQMSVRRSARSLAAVGLAIEEDKHPEGKGKSTQCHIFCSNRTQGCQPCGRNARRASGSLSLGGSGKFRPEAVTVHSITGAFLSASPQTLLLALA